MDIVALIGTVGFPIAVCVYLLYERNKAMKELVKVITALTVLIKTRMK